MYNYSSLTCEVLPVAPSVECLEESFPLCAVNGVSCMGQTLVADT